jgi:hypothetical protein
MILKEITRQFKFEEQTWGTVRSLDDWRRVITDVAKAHNGSTEDAETYVLDNARQDDDGVFGFYPEHTGITVRQFLAGRPGVQTKSKKAPATAPVAVPTQAVPRRAAVATAPMPGWAMFLLLILGGLLLLALTQIRNF